MTVHDSTANGTATAPGDYAATNRRLTFAPGETVKTITIQVNGDKKKEQNETFSVSLMNADGNATITHGRAVGTILNDDGMRSRHVHPVRRALKDRRR